MEVKETQLSYTRCNTLNTHCNRHYKTLQHIPTHITTYPYIKMHVPPPMMVMAPLAVHSARVLATSLVPAANCYISNITLQRRFAVQLKWIVSFCATKVNRVIFLCNFCAKKQKVTLQSRFAVQLKWIVSFCATKVNRVNFLCNFGANFCAQVIFCAVQIKWIVSFFLCIIHLEANVLATP